MIHVNQSDHELYDWLLSQGYIDAGGYLLPDLSPAHKTAALAIIAFYGDLKTSRLEKIRERYEAHVARRLLGQVFGGGRG